MVRHFGCERDHWIGIWKQSPHSPLLNAINIENFIKVQNFEALHSDVFGMPVFKYIPTTTAMRVINIKDKSVRDSVLTGIVKASACGIPLTRTAIERLISLSQSFVEGDDC